jgi:hypothetical protein
MMVEPFVPCPARPLPPPAPRDAPLALAGAGFAPFDAAPFILVIFPLSWRAVLTEIFAVAGSLL